MLCMCFEGIFCEGRIWRCDGVKEMCFIVRTEGWCFTYMVEVYPTVMFACKDG
jgi:hypothetical protein